ncbi:unnamed protein product [Larinioides sclopetarius]|uniref:Uncharacterized protein n=1 Tax=Larinioides sclopetarius TaxID=280406 RepID=A0AAV2ARJ5_9ARAC
MKSILYSCLLLSLCAAVSARCRPCNRRTEYYSSQDDPRRNVLLPGEGWHVPRLHHKISLQSFSQGLLHFRLGRMRRERKQFRNLRRMHGNMQGSLRTTYGFPLRSAFKDVLRRKKYS